MTPPTIPSTIPIFEFGDFPAKTKMYGQFSRTTCKTLFYQIVNFPANTETSNLKPNDVRC